MSPRAWSACEGNPFLSDTHTVNAHVWRKERKERIFCCLDFLSVGSEESRSPTNYELNLEIQWTNVDYTRPNKILYIKTGAFSGSEDILVRIWNSTNSSWDLIMILTANQWNNVSVSAYLTGSTFTVQFLGGTESGDATQDSWNIDCSLLRTIPHVWMLTIKSAVGGTTNPPAGTHTYGENEIATVMATPNPNYVFDHWQYKGHTSTSNPISLTMGGDNTLTPVFVYPGSGVPEFPIGAAIEILFMPAIVYILWRSKHRKKMSP